MTQPLDSEKRFKTIVADPPWPYKNKGMTAAPSHRPNSYDSKLGNPGSVARYGGISIDELRLLTPPAENNAHLYLWVTNAFIESGYEICRAWGFRPVSFLTWTKTRHDDPTKASMKTGYWFRGATEHVLFGVKGSLKLTTKKAIPTGFMWPRLPHSQKPDAFFDLVEEVSPGPYLEMFARRPRIGWSTWGDEVANDVFIKVGG